MKKCLCGYEGNDDKFKPHIFKVERIAPDWPINHIWFYAECDNCGRHTQHTRSIKEAEELWEKEKVRMEG